jgi:hypothetical protein
MHSFPAAHLAGVTAMPAITIPGHIASSPVLAAACWIPVIGYCLAVIIRADRKARRTYRLRRPL